jgi:hypothetical protein
MHAHAYACVTHAAPSANRDFKRTIAVRRMGLLIFSVVQAIFVRVLTTGNPDEIYWKQSLDQLNFMMHDSCVAPHLRMRVRDYFRKSKQMHKRVSYEQLIDRCLSHELRGDVRFHISRRLFRPVWWLNTCERSFLEELSIYMRHEAFEASSPVYVVDQLNILAKGVCQRNGVVVTAGAENSAWGDVLLSSPRLRDTRVAKTVTYCEFVRIERTILFQVAQGYPDSLRVLRNAALRLATLRAVLIIAAFTRLKRIRSQKKPVCKDGLAGCKGSCSSNDSGTSSGTSSSVSSGVSSGVSDKTMAMLLSEPPEDLLRGLHSKLISVGANGPDFREKAELLRDEALALQEGTAPSSAVASSSSIHGDLLEELRGMRAETSQQQAVMMQRLVRLEATVSQLSQAPTQPPSQPAVATELHAADSAPAPPIAERKRSMSIGSSMSAFEMRVNGRMDEMANALLSIEGRLAFMLTKVVPAHESTHATRADALAA